MQLAQWQRPSTVCDTSAITRAVQYDDLTVYRTACPIFLLAAT